MWKNIIIGVSYFQQLAEAGYMVKITLLVGVWVFFTVVFLMHNEKMEVTRHSSVAPGQVKGENNTLIGLY